MGLRYMDKKLLSIPNKIDKNKIKSYLKQNINIIIAFCSYFFSFLLLEQIINNNISNKIGVEYVLIIYSISAMFTALGYISYSIVNNKINNRKSYQWILGILFGITNILNIILNGKICIITSLLSSYLLGIIGANLLYQLSLNSITNRHIGKTIGISITIALILQIIVYKLITNIIILSITITIGSLISIIFMIKNKNIDENIKLFKKDETLSKNDFILPIFTVIIISIIIGLQDGVITYIDSIGKINVYGLPRIFYIIGM